MKWQPPHPFSWTDEDWKQFRIGQREAQEILARYDVSRASVVLAVDPSWSTPEKDCAVISRIPPEEQQ